MRRWRAWRAKRRGRGEGAAAGDLVAARTAERLAVLLAHEHIWSEGGPATAEELLLCHTAEHVELIRDVEDPVWLDGDTICTATTYEAAALAAGTAIDAEALGAKGAHTLFFEGGRIRVETVADTRGDRPWAPRLPKDDPPVPDPAGDDWPARGRRLP